MTPYQQAKAAHEADPDNFGLPLIISQHLRTGIVISTPTLFWLARPVDMTADHYQFDYPHVTFDNPNCWHIYLAAGTLPTIYEALPYPLEFVSYVRKNRLHFQNMKKMGLRSQRFLKHGRTAETSKGTRASE